MPSNGEQAALAGLARSVCANLGAARTQRCGFMARILGSYVCAGVPGLRDEREQVQSASLRAHRTFVIVLRTLIAPSGGTRCAARRRACFFSPWFYLSSVTSFQLLP